MILSSRDKLIAKTHAREYLKFVRVLHDEWIPVNKSKIIRDKYTESILVY